MRRNSLTALLSKNAGNHRRRQDLLKEFSLPGLSVDNVATTPVSTGGFFGQSGLAAQLPQSPAGDVGQQVAQLSKQLSDLRAVQQAQTDKVNENTLALLQNTVAKSSSGSGTANTAGSLVSSLLGGGFGLSPILNGILKLFGGSSGTTVQPLVPFTLPTAIQYAGGVSQSATGVVPIDYGQNGKVRPLNGQSSTNSSSTTGAPTVQIQVNAMDSQSFMDHSEDIARAVRQALLNSSSLNDVITDL